MSLKSFIRAKVMRLRSEISTEDLIALGLTVGKNFSRQEKTLIDQSHCWLITIGDDVTLAPRVHILAHDASTKKALGYTRIGVVNIGNNVVIGANSVVSRDIPDDSVAIGNPAKVICTYDEFVSRKKKELENNPCFDESYTLRNPKISEDMKKEMKEKLEKSKIGYVV